MIGNFLGARCCLLKMVLHQMTVLDSEFEARLNLFLLKQSVPQMLLHLFILSQVDKLVGGNCVLPLGTQVGILLTWGDLFATHWVDSIALNEVQRVVLVGSLSIFVSIRVGFLGDLLPALEHGRYVLQIRCRGHTLIRVAKRALVGVADFRL